MPTQSAQNWRRTYAVFRWFAIHWMMLTVRDTNLLEPWPFWTDKADLRHETRLAHLILRRWWFHGRNWGQRSHQICNGIKGQVNLSRSMSNRYSLKEICASWWPFRLFDSSMVNTVLEQRVRKQLCVLVQRVFVDILITKIELTNFTRIICVALFDSRWVMSAIIKIEINIYKKKLEMSIGI